MNGEKRLIIAASKSNNNRNNLKEKEENNIQKSRKQKLGEKSNIWILLPLISSSSSLFFKFLGIIPMVSSTIDITVMSMIFHNFGKGPGICPASSFPSLSLYGLLKQQNTLDDNFFTSSLLKPILTIISQSPREFLYTSFFKTDSDFFIISLSVCSNFKFLRNS